MVSAVQLIELLGAIAALQQKSLAARRLGKLTLEKLDFPGGDERR